MCRLFCLTLIMLLTACMPPKKDGSPDYPYYAGNDLGVTYMPAQTTFKIWSPAAVRVHVHLYTSGKGGAPLQSLPLTRDGEGVWQIIVQGDLKGRFYTFQIETPSGKLEETPGIYAKAVGVNGRRGAIVSPSQYNPAGWDQDFRPAFGNRTDAVIYEMHVRDFTIDASTSHTLRGKYLGVVEPNTTNAFGQATGIDHLVELGVTHVHLLPVFDFRSLDESKPDSAQYNWGYDPQNYNVPEGTYATDAFDPATRIREFKQMVMGLHARGIRVIMDVVYNHTGATENADFNLEMPGYYYRRNPDGTLSNASACGNETASERAMMRKFMIASCKYWVNEYHIDGFRFDLMGIHDIETLNLLTDELLQIEPSLLFYGEGWTAGASPLPDSLRALKKYTYRLKHVAAFSDDLRDGLKGSVFEHQATGFVSGAAGLGQSIRFGVVASIWHPQVDYQKVNYSTSYWAREPWQCINYVSCHDNHTLWDKLTISVPTADEATRIRMDHLANGIVLTAQGIPFLHAGEEILRSKNGVENSYNKPDTINKIDWNRKKIYHNTFRFYRDLIGLRKMHPAFRLNSAKQIVDLLTFLDSPPGTVLYRINGREVNDPWSEILVIYNGNSKPTAVALPAGAWALQHDGHQLKAGATTLQREAHVPALSLMIFSK